MNKKTLTLALVAATIAVTCVQLSAGQPAGIRVEAVGIPVTHLTASPQIKTLPCANFHQYKVIGHFSSLTLGDAPQNENNWGSATGKPLPRQWNRISLSRDSWTRPLDLFKSSMEANATTGHVVMACSPVELAKRGSNPVMRLEGTTRNPTGSVILCVDFIAKPLRPKGSLNLAGMSIRDGQKIHIGWNRSQ